MFLPFGDLILQCSVFVFEQCSLISGLYCGLCMNITMSSFLLQWEGGWTLKILLNLWPPNFWLKQQGWLGWRNLKMPLKRWVSLIDAFVQISRLNEANVQQSTNTMVNFSLSLLINYTLLVFTPSNTVWHRRRRCYYIWRAETCHEKIIRWTYQQKWNWRSGERSWQQRRWNRRLWRWETVEVCTQDNNKGSGWFQKHIQDKRFREPGDSVQINVCCLCRVCENDVAGMRTTQWRSDNEDISIQF